MAKIIPITEHLQHFLAEMKHQRDRVLTEKEIQKYLETCPQPWKDCAVLILDEGLRPAEVFALQWPHVSFENVAIQIADGKSRAARRVLPMTPRVQAVLLERWETAGKPNPGFIFPGAGRCGHFDQNVARISTRGRSRVAGSRPLCPTLSAHLADSPRRKGRRGYIRARADRRTQHDFSNATVYPSPGGRDQPGFRSIVTEGKHKIGHSEQSSPAENAESRKAECS